MFSHDANLLYLQRLLRINWIPQTFQQNAALPGGLLAFDLFVDSSGGGDDEARLEFYVKVQGHLLQCMSFRVLGS